MANHMFDNLLETQKDKGMDWEHGHHQNSKVKVGQRYDTGVVSVRICFFLNDIFLAYLASGLTFHGAHRAFELTPGHWCKPTKGSNKVETRQWIGSRLWQSWTSWPHCCRETFGRFRGSLSNSPSPSLPRPPAPWIPYTTSCRRSRSFSQLEIFWNIKWTHLSWKFGILKCIHITSRRNP